MLNIMQELSSFVLTGVSSGSGKTTVSLGLMAAFSDIGLKVQPFKCGPDFIDPGLHKLVTGTISRNLDIWMSSEAFVKDCYARFSHGSDVAIVEGVMGMFDGGVSSSAALAEVLGLPTILVIDVSSMAESAAALIKGFESLRPQVAPAGVILNRIASPRHLQLVTDAVKKHCRAEILGYLPRTVEFSIPSRHLGLLTSEESPLRPEAISTLITSVKKHIDLDRLYKLCRQSAPQSPARKSSVNSDFTLAVARDKAFCFYYEDNFDLFRNEGVDIATFSPLKDTKLPADTDAVYLGGGYPELYARQLSQNTAMLAELRRWNESSRVMYAECGGFMYLTDGIYDMENRFHPMAGIFPVKTKMQKTRASLGYRDIVTRTESCFGPAGARLRGHEFHYSVIDEMNPGITRVYQVNNEFEEGYQVNRTLGGYMHLHLGHSVEAVKQFIKYSRE